MLGIIRMIVVGLVVGILARFFYPGQVPLNLLPTLLLGIGGSMLAGLIGLAIHRRSGEGFHPAGFFYSLLGAIVLIFISKHFLHII